MTEYLYNYKGKAIAHIKNSVVYSISGKTLAFIKDEYVYLYNGVQIGTFENGWMRDLQGACVLYCEKHSGSAPIAPIHQIPPIPSITQIPPIKPISQIPRIKAIKQMSWSKFKGEDFFERR